jgi:hypothetical protein
MTKSIIIGSMAALMLSVGLFVARERPEWVPIMGHEEKEEPVLVFLVGSPQGVAMMRRAVDPGRVVAETPNAIALAEGRMVAASAEAVGAPLVAAGWSDRKLEIITVPKSEGLERSSQAGPGGQGGGADDPRMARLAELRNKPTLNVGDLIFLMNAMNNGLL